MHLRSKLIISLAFLFLSSNSVASKRPDLYESGKSAFDEGDHVTALKNLYAFYVLNEATLSDHTEFKQLLEEKIKHCEAYLNGLHGWISGPGGVPIPAGVVPIFRGRAYEIEGIKGKLDQILHRLNEPDFTAAPAGSGPGNR